ncbi:hypothetical protein ASD54_25120 [Rhizobium sp. Root149]|uniref:Uncharacterized protein n=1 Tax=Rhizobium rhizoryzae TaxID=451876 RepID=A0A7W6LMJ5_9HYPH|nr:MULTISPECIES: hypothetical protein [Rhizobium]KQZ56748.1 hypothetical protein ASD54_25120 [Rhizobium sp. Root149]MBB4146168.1 hypothetical protein [Rhizobium rhizoryzae]
MTAAIGLLVVSLSRLEYLVERDANPDQSITLAEVNVSRKFIMKIAASNKMTFAPAKALKDALNK